MLCFPYPLEQGGVCGGGRGGGGGDGTSIYMSYVGMCCPKGFGF